MAVDPKVYDDKMLEIMNSLQIQPSFEEQMGIGPMDLLAPSWNLPGGPEGGIYSLMPGMEYAPSMATSPIVAPPPGGPGLPPEVVTDDSDADLGPISSAPGDGLPPAGGNGSPSLPGYDPEVGWTLEFIDKVLGGEIDLTDPQYGVPEGEGPGVLDNLRNWLENRDPDITLPGGDFNTDWLDPDFDWGNPDDITLDLNPVPLDTWPTGEIDEINIDLDPNAEGGWAPKWDNLEDLLADADIDRSDPNWADKIGDFFGETSGLPSWLGGELLGDLITGGVGGIQDLLGAIPGIGDIFKPGGGIANLLDLGGDALGNIRGGIGNLLGLGNLPFFGGEGPGIRGGIGNLLGLGNMPFFGGEGQGIGGWLRNLFDGDDAGPEDDGGSMAHGGIAEYPRVNALIEGPGTERSDDIKAMLSDGEFVTNAAALRGIGRLNGADPKDKAEQRRIGAREMYRLQREGEKAAGVTT